MGVRGVAINTDLMIVWISSPLWDGKFGRARTRIIRQHSFGRRSPTARQWSASRAGQTIHTPAFKGCAPPTLPDGTSDWPGAQVSTLAQKSGNAGVKVRPLGEVEQDEPSNDNLCTRSRDCDWYTFRTSTAQIWWLDMQD